MKTSIVFYPNKLKKSARYGKTLVYMRICFKAQKSETRLNADLNELQLQNWDPITMRIAERNSSINHYLNRLDQKFADFLILNATNLHEYSATAIKDFILGKNLEQKKDGARIC
jgi:hypothetical protein